MKRFWIGVVKSPMRPALTDADSQDLLLEFLSLPWGFYGMSGKDGPTDPFFHDGGVGRVVLPSTWTPAEVGYLQDAYGLDTIEVTMSEEDYDGYISRLSTR